MFLMEWALHTGIRFLELPKFLAMCVHVHAHTCMNMRSAIDLIRDCWFSCEKPDLSNVLDV